MDYNRVVEYEIKNLILSSKILNLQKSKYDACIYYYYNNQNLIIVAVFVDDILVFTNSIKFTNIIKESLSEVFSIKDLGPVRKCLGINVMDRSKGIIELNQTDFIVSLLKDYDMLECRSTSTPMTTEVDHNTTMLPSRPSDPDKLKKIPYQNAVGSLLFLVQATRPDLAFQQLL